MNSSGFRELQEGEAVTCDVTQGQKGPHAKNISVAWAAQQELRNPDLCRDRRTGRWGRRRA
ncbi:cold shock domain-containing protein [Streptomyces sp. NBC_01594]